MFLKVLGPFEERDRNRLSLGVFSNLCFRFVHAKGKQNFGEFNAWHTFGPVQKRVLGMVHFWTSLIGL